MDQKRTDYFKVGAKQYKEIRNEYKDGKLPSLLLHVCCGPCSSHVIKDLCNHFQITIYYSTFIFPFWFIFKSFKFFKYLFNLLFKT